MKILACTDSHLGLQTEIMDRTQDVYESLDKIISYAIKEKVDVFCFLGDWYHDNKPSTYLEKLSIRLLNRLEIAKIETVMIIGNHCVIAAPGKIHALEPLQEIGYRYIHIIDDVDVVWIKKVKFICLPHITKARLVDKGEKITKPDKYFDMRAKEILGNLDDSTVNIVLSHLNIEGAEAGSEGYFIKGEHENFPVSLKNSDKIDMILNGHIHRRQILDGNIILPGSIQRNNFAEAGDEKSFMILEV